MSILKYKDYEVYYDFQGSKTKPVVVLLNGIMMSTLSWEPFMEALTPEVDVLRFDMLDQGQSSKLNKTYTQEVQVDVLLALLNHLKLDKIHLVGISYGGSVALQFAINHQNRLDSLIVFNAVMQTSPWLKAIGEGWNEVAKTRNGFAYYHITIPMIYSPSFYHQNLKWMEARKEKLIPIFSNPTFLDAMIRLTQSAETHDVSDRLPSVNTRTLIVASEHDYLTPPFEQAKLVRAMPHARMITYNDCGHASMYEKPDLFVTTILGFIKENHYNYKI